MHDERLNTRECSLADRSLVLRVSIKGVRVVEIFNDSDPVILLNGGTRIFDGDPAEGTGSSLSPTPVTGCPTAKTRIRRMTQTRPDLLRVGGEISPPNHQRL